MPTLSAAVSLPKTGRLFMFLASLVTAFSD